MKNIYRILMITIFTLLLSACSTAGNDEAAAENSEPETTEAVEEADQVQETENQADIPEEEISEETADQNDVLIVYFSRANNMEESEDAVSGASVVVGNTELVAEMIRQETGGELFRVVTEQGYPASYDETTEIAAAEQDADERPALAVHIENIEQYDTIYLGYPIWWGTMPMAMFTLLEEYDFSGKTIIPFCSHGGSGLGSSIADISELCPDSEILDGLAIRGDDAEGAQDQVIGWIREQS